MHSYPWAQILFFSLTAPGRQAGRQVRRDWLWLRTGPHGVLLDLCFAQPSAGRSTDLPSRPAMAAAFSSTSLARASRLSARPAAREGVQQHSRRTFLAACPQPVLCHLRSGPWSGVHTRRSSSPTDEQNKSCGKHTRTFLTQGPLTRHLLERRLRPKLLARKLVDALLQGLHLLCRKQKAAASGCLTRRR